MLVLTSYLECVGIIFGPAWRDWWGIDLGSNCSFVGQPYFRRHTESRISISGSCEFNSSPTSNSFGVNRPCIISSLREGAEIQIGFGCGFSGTVIGCGTRIILKENVRYGANKLITDTDWYLDDERSGPNRSVIIKRDVWLGVNVMVLKGVTIGENTIVSSGSIVTRTLPLRVIAAGRPARVICPS